MVGDHFPAGRIDPRQRVVGRVRNPNGPVPVGDGARPVSDLDRPDLLARSRIDLRDVAIELVHDPHLAASHGHGGWAVPDGNAVNRAPVGIDTQHEILGGVRNPNGSGAVRDASGLAPAGDDRADIVVRAVEDADAVRRGDKRLRPREEPGGDECRDACGNEEAGDGKHLSAADSTRLRACSASVARWCLQ